MKLRIILPLAFLVPSLFAINACGDDDDTKDTASETDTDTDADTDTDTDTDADADADLSTYIKGYDGEATVTPKGYDGWEGAYLFSLDDMAVACHISYDVISVGQGRTDCSECMWAYDLATVSGSGRIDTDESGMCNTAFGANESNVATFADGWVFSYGFALEYVGPTYTYSNVLMYYFSSDQAWYGVAYADFDQKTGIFSYDWMMPYYSYY